MIKLPNWREPEPKAGAHEAFVDENPFAREAQQNLSIAAGKHQASEARTNYLVEAQAWATLAVAYEQRQARFDVETAIQSHAEQTRGY